jgi:hypothetical protein
MTTMTEKGKHAGRSILERLWTQMDLKYDALMEFRNKLDPEYAKLQGQCTGLAYALCVMQYPYNDVKEGMDKIRAEARQRYEANLDEDESDEYDPEDE